MSEIKAKKSLGQNFLKDQKALERIVAAAELKENDNVLEIGPGKGALSRELMKAAGKLIMIEKDDDLAEDVARKFQISNHKYQINSKPQNLNFKNRAAVISGDILEVNLPEVIEQNDFQNYKVVANIPYYITGKIIRLLFETKYQAKLVVLLVQKEVAERICAEPGHLSILAVSVQCFGVSEIIAQVPKESFDPQPKVDSAILKITPHEKSFFKDKQEEKAFFALVKAGFGAKRKTLVNNLFSSLSLDKNEVALILKKVGLQPTQRAQELSTSDWKKLLKETR
jgi:16S rRNA (adenine1518-N6/adenine1519-N6)-dimethyltransferase